MCSTSSRSARQRPHVRARGRHAAHARRGQQERDRRAAPRDRAPRVLARLGEDEALLHDRPADRERRRRARHRRDRRARAGKSASTADRPQAPRSRAACQHPRAQAAHAVSVVRDGHAPSVAAQASAAARRRRAALGVELKMHDVDGSVARRRFRARRSQRRRRARARVPRGARFDSWDEQLEARRVERGVRAKPASTRERFLGTIPTSARLPWDHIDVGLEDGFLAREYRKALKNRLSPPCGKAAGMFVHHTNVEEHEPTAQAGLLRLRRRLRHGRDARASAATSWSRCAPTSRASRPSTRGAVPPRRERRANRRKRAARAAGAHRSRRAAAPAPALRKARPRRVRLAPRPGAHAAAPVQAPVGAGVLLARLQLRSR